MCPALRAAISTARGPEKVLQVSGLWDAGRGTGAALSTQEVMLATGVAPHRALHPHGRLWTWALGARVPTAAPKDAKGKMCPPQHPAFSSCLTVTEHLSGPSVFALTSLGNTLPPVSARGMFMTLVFQGKTGVARLPWGLGAPRDRQHRVQGQLGMGSLIPGSSGQTALLQPSPGCPARRTPLPGDPGRRLAACLPHPSQAGPGAAFWVPASTPELREEEAPSRTNTASRLKAQEKSEEGHP